jgi:membrane-bound serine protease (ClpP class)
VAKLKSKQEILLARRFVGLFVFGLGSALMVAQSHEAPSGSGAPVVYAADVDAIIHPVSAEYMITTMDRADRAGATLVVFTLRTPGGLVESTRDIITHMLASRTPVAIFIGPSGARAASAGFLLTIAADLAAMAPGTHIGAAHPVAGSGEQMDETMAKKTAADVAAYARTRQHASSERALAEEAANAAAPSPSGGAQRLPPLIDLVVSDLPSCCARWTDAPSRGLTGRRSS